MTKFSKMKKDELEEIATKAFSSMEKLQGEVENFSSKVSEIDAAHAKIAQYKVLMSELEELDAKFDSSTYQQKLKEINNIHKQTKDFEKELFEPSTGLQARFKKLETDMTQTLNDANTSLTKISGSDGFEEKADKASQKVVKLLAEAKMLHIEFITGEKDKPSIKQQIIDALDKVSKMEVKIKAFYDELLKEGTEEGQKEPSSLRHKLLEHHTELRKLVKKMNDLLPKAATTGLAYSYYDAKSYHGPSKIKHDDDLSGKERIWISMARFVKPIFFYTIFIGPILFTISMFSPVLLGVGVIDLILGKIPNQSVTAQEINWLGVMFRLLVAIPMGLISYFGFTSIQRSRKLYEEYDHKQRVMELYTGFKKEAESMGDVLGDHLHRKKLMSIVLETVEDKPSSIRDYTLKHSVNDEADIVKDSPKPANANTLKKAPSKKTAKKAQD